MGQVQQWHNQLLAISVKTFLHNLQVESERVRLEIETIFPYFFAWCRLCFTKIAISFNEIILLWLYSCVRCVGLVSLLFCKNKHSKTKSISSTNTFRCKQFYKICNLPIAGHSRSNWTNKVLLHFCGLSFASLAREHGNSFKI